MPAAVIEGVVGLGHFPKRHRFLRGETAVRVMVSQHVIAGTVEGFPNLQEFSVAIVGPTEVSHLQNEGGILSLHRGDKGRQTGFCIVHHIMMRVGTQAEADRSEGGSSGVVATDFPIDAERGIGDCDGFQYIPA